MRFCAHLIGLFLLLASPTLAMDTIARAAMVVDQKTGTVLLAKNENEALPPASMSKLMTLNMLFEALQDGRVSLDTKFTVSAKASATSRGEAPSASSDARIASSSMRAGITSTSTPALRSNCARISDPDAKIMRWAMWITFGRNPVLPNGWF